MVTEFMGRFPVSFDRVVSPALLRAYDKAPYVRASVPAIRIEGKGPPGRGSRCLLVVGASAGASITGEREFALGEATLPLITRRCVIEIAKESTAGGGSFFHTPSFLGAVLGNALVGAFEALA